MICDIYVSRSCGETNSFESVTGLYILVLQKFLGFGSHLDCIFCEIIVQVVF